MSGWNYPKYTDEGDYIGTANNFLDGPCTFCEMNGENFTCKLDVMERTLENCAGRRVEKWLDAWKDRELERLRSSTPTANKEVS